MNLEYNNRDSSSMITRDYKAVVTTPAGNHAFTSNIERSSDLVKMTNVLVVLDKRSTMTARYSMGRGELTIDSPYIRYGDITVVDVEFNHSEGRADSMVSWAPTKKVKHSGFICL